MTFSLKPFILYKTTTRAEAWMVALPARRTRFTYNFNWTEVVLLEHECGSYNWHVSLCAPVILRLIQHHLDDPNNADPCCEAPYNYKA